METIQLLAFALFPALPVVQFVNNALKAIFLILTGTAGNLQYFLAATCGKYVFEVSQASGQNPFRARLIHVPFQDLSSETYPYLDGRWLGRFLLIFANLTPVTLSLVNYFQRLCIRAGEATYVGSVGLDHRLGWVAFGGMFSTVGTLMLHLVNPKWSYNPPPLATVDPDRELGVFLEIMAAAWCQELLILITGRITPVILLQRLLGQHAKLVFVTVALIGLLFINYQRHIAIVFSNPASRLRKSSLFGSVVLLVLYCSAIAFLQLFVDVEEIADIRMGWVYPWNYRWQMPNPSWWML